VNEWRVLTWNVQGGHGLDLGFIGAHITAQRPDVVAIQEIQRRQARRLGDVIDMAHRWARKHTPCPGFSEGMAIYATGPIKEFTAEVVTPAAPWSWRRRIVVRAVITNPATMQTLRLLNVHLSPHDAADRRAEELACVSRMDATQSIDVIAGDFNSDLTTAAPNLARHRDTTPNGPPTCWAPGPRIGRLPVQRLDGVFAADGWSTVASHTPTTDLDRWAAASDHLPVAVTLRP
jgi:endonuclease/exonuclease/phosphatase family metal-dependent hydrolase